MTRFVFFPIFCSNCVLRYFNLFCGSIGGNIKILIDRPDGKYCFREHKDRIYYMSQAILNLASTCNQEQLVCAGTCFGKFTKSNKFRLHITALNYLAPYAQVFSYYYVLLTNLIHCILLCFLFRDLNKFKQFFSTRSG